ncbi:MAG: hypothetical protein C4K48_04555 [Candidatus Thorarchaeota archaeon]|nr:MAG: hypothetical protein C4K48_04555 [Candidatus Thorarchaeota archaeon]
MAEIPTPTSGSSASSRSRPLGITILAILMFLGGIFNLYGIVTSYTYFDMAWSAIAGILGLILAVAMWKLIPWARKVSLIWYIISLIMVLAMIFYLGGLLGVLLGPLVIMVLLIAALPAIVIDLIIIFYLNSGGVKAAFEGVGGW